MAIRFTESIQRFAGAALLSVAFFVAVAGVRLVLEGRRNIDKARYLLEADDRSAAISAFEDAAKSFFPGSPYPSNAHRELAILAKAAEMRGEKEESIYAWRVVRRSILATRNVYQPNKRRLAEAEKEIERLLSSEMEDDAVAKDDPGRSKRPARALSRTEDPDPFVSIALFLGLAVWFIGSVAVCAAPRQQDKTDSNFRRWAWAASLGGLALWLAMAWIAG